MLEDSVRNKQEDIRTFKTVIFKNTSKILNDLCCIPVWLERLLAGVCENKNVF